MSKVIVALLCLAVACSAVTIVEVDTYSTTGCTGSTAIAEYFPLATCVADTSFSSQLTAVTGGYLESTYNGAVCANSAIATLQYNSTCSSGGGISTIASVNSAGSWIVYNIFTNSDCSGAVTEGPTYFLVNGCVSIGSISTEYTVSGGSLNVCTYTTANCGGTATCGSSGISSGQCIAGASYTFSAGAATLPTLSVIALVSIITLAFSRFTA